MIDLTHTSTHYQHTVALLAADIRAGGIPRKSYAELRAAIAALWDVLLTTRIEPVRPVMSERVPF